ncbi:MAG: hypothetical protein HY812_13905 [Planctomycetes bacterium]|nr:hypothetical protein [Planctomycetota bacterium]
MRDETVQAVHARLAALQVAALRGHDERPGEEQREGVGVHVARLDVDGRVVEFLHVPVRLDELPDQGDLGQHVDRDGVEVDESGLLLVGLEDVEEVAALLLGQVEDVLLRFLAQAGAQREVLRVADFERDAEEQGHVLLRLQGVDLLPAQPLALVQLVPFVALGRLLRDPVPLVEHLARGLHLLRVLRLVLLEFVGSEPLALVEDLPQPLVGLGVQGVELEYVLQDGAVLVQQAVLLGVERHRVERRDVGACLAAAVRHFFLGKALALDAIDFGALERHAAELGVDLDRRRPLADDFALDLLSRLEMHDVGRRLRDEEREEEAGHAEQPADHVAHRFAEHRFLRARRRRRR